MTQKRFEGQVAIVTGGAWGIGLATAEKLAAEGVTVLIADIDIETARQRVLDINGKGQGRSEYIHTDVRVPEDNELMVAYALKQWGRLDIIVLNAFYNFPRMPKEFIGSADELSPEVFDQGLNALTNSVFLGVHYAIPEMKKVGHGSIVNMASIHSFLQTPGWLTYEAGKAAVLGMTRQMACEYGPFGIRVNCVCPGHIVNEHMAKHWAARPGSLEFLSRVAPLRRTGTPQDIANAVAFLCSDEASFITGHALVVDGGVTLQLQEGLAMEFGKPDWNIG